LNVIGGTAAATVGLSFVASAVLKFLAPGRAATAAETVGVPRSLARPAVLALSIVELGLAAALILLPSRAVAAAAVATVGLLSVVLIGLRRRAPTLSCGCFGELGTGDQLGGLVRNALLLGLLAVVAVRPATPSAWGAAAALEIALLLAVGTEGVPMVRQLKTGRLRPGV
jgi:hypothetical protein